MATTTLNPSEISELIKSRIEKVKLSAEARNDPQVLELIERVHRHLAEAQQPPPVELATRVAQDGNDLQARLELAKHYMGQKAWAPALEQLLEIVRRDRTFGEDIGRKTMIEIFGLASAQPELVSEWRRRLSSVLL